MSRFSTGLTSNLPKTHVQHQKDIFGLIHSHCNPLFRHQRVKQPATRQKRDAMTQKKELAQKSGSGEGTFGHLSKKSQNAVKNPSSVNSLQKAPPFLTKSDIRNPRIYPRHQQHEKRPWPAISAKTPCRNENKCRFPPEKGVGPRFQVPPPSSLSTKTLSLHYLSSSTIGHVPLCTAGEGSFFYVELVGSGWGCGN